jgi:hypothetical protein
MEVSGQLYAAVTLPCKTRFCSLEPSSVDVYLVKTCVIKRIHFNHWVLNLRSLSNNWITCNIKIEIKCKRINTFKHPCFCNTYFAVTICFRKLQLHFAFTVLIHLLHITFSILQSYGGTYIYLLIGNLDQNEKTGCKNWNCGVELFEECSRSVAGV